MTHPSTNYPPGPVVTLTIRDDTSVSKELPEYFNIPEVEEFGRKLQAGLIDQTCAPHTHILIGKQVLCEPDVEERPRSPIDWGSARVGIPGQGGRLSDDYFRIKG